MSHPATTTTRRLAVAAIAVSTAAILGCLVLLAWISATYDPPHGADRPNLADWMQALARAVVFGGVELAASDPIGGMGITRVRVDVANYGTNPILNVQAKVSIFGVTVASNAFLTIGAGSTETVRTTTRPEEPMLPDRSVNEIRADVNLEVTFTDVNGLQWRRQGTDQPERILESAGEAPAAS